MSNHVSANLLYTIMFTNKLCYVLISVLEFELRKAHDTIKALRGSLTEATGKCHEFQF